MRGQAVFDIDERLKQLSAKGDKREWLSAVADFTSNPHKPIMTKPEESAGCSLALKVDYDGIARSRCVLAAASSRIRMRQARSPLLQTVHRPRFRCN